MIVIESPNEKIIDPQSQGLTFIGKGNEYRVYDGVTTEDGVDRVVKVPRKRWYHGHFKPRPTREQAEEDYRIVADYFNNGDKPIFADTQFWGTGENYRVLQGRIDHPRNIRRSDMRNPVIATQLQDILRRNNEMFQTTGKSLGIIGQEGALSLLYFRPKITNIVLGAHEEKAHGIDFGLLHRNNLLGKLAIMGNAIVLQTFFGVNMRGEKVRSPFAPRIRRN